MLAWIAFPLLTLAAMIFAGTQILFTLGFNLPWAIWAAARGQLRAKAIFLQAVTPAFWLGLLLAVAFLWSRFAPGGLAYFLSHPGTKAGFFLGLFWLLVGTFSTGGRRDRTEDRAKYLRAFGK